MCVNDYFKSLFDNEINREPCFVKKHRFTKELFVIFASLDIYNLCVWIDTFIIDISVNDMQVFNMHLCHNYKHNKKPCDIMLFYIMLVCIFFDFHFPSTIAFLVSLWPWFHEPLEQKKQATFLHVYRYFWYSFELLFVHDCFKV